MQKKIHFIFILIVELVKDKVCLTQLKEKYTRALIYEFELTKRSPTFFQSFSDVSFMFLEYHFIGVRLGRLDLRFRSDHFQDYSVFHG